MKTESVILETETGIWRTEIAFALLMERPTPDFSHLKLYKWHLKLISEAATGGEFGSFIGESVSDASSMLKFSIKVMNGY